MIKKIKLEQFFFFPIFVYLFSVVVLTQTILTGYNSFAITFPLLISLILCTTYYMTLIYFAKTKNKYVNVLYLSQFINNIIFGVIGTLVVISIFVLSSYGNINLVLQGSLGLLLFWATVFTPTVTCLHLYLRNKKIEVNLQSIVVFTIGQAYSTFNLFWLGFFAYLYLVYLFPTIYGLNT